MKKAQSALEYLMTYGWAILIVVIVAAALYAMGVFNPAAWSGKRVMGLSYFQVADWKMDNTGNLSLVLGNRYGKSINITTVTADCAGSSLSDSPGVILSPNKETSVGITGYPALDTGSAIDCEITIDYVDTKTDLAHSDYGTISGAVENP